MRPFVHLHVHTEYSLLDGAIRCKEIAQKVASWGESGGNAVAISDHGVMYGAIEFYSECKAAHVNPIIGCEIYLDTDGHTSRERRDDKRNHHLLLLAENNEGYKNLVKLVSIANTDGFYYKPRIDHDLLARYGKGIIASSACLAGEIPMLILEGNEQGALERAMFYRDLMGKDNFFLEIMYNQIPKQAIVNKALIKISRATGIPLIATNDAHYLNKEDFNWHEILLCVQTKSLLTDHDRMSFDTPDFYLRPPEEMNQIFGAEVPDALDNTKAIADRCNVTFNLNSGEYLLPNLDLNDGETLNGKLAHDAREGLIRRVGAQKAKEPPYADRLEFELNIINNMGFAGYYLIVAGIITAAKDKGIPIGPGRGSGAGSLVAWSTRITELDPLKYGLLFERFLNPERISMPDFDTDVSDKGRDELMRYIVNRYGSDRVSQIITFGRMKSRAAIKDVGRVLDVPYNEIDQVAKLVPFNSDSIGDAIENVADLKKIYNSNERIKKVIDSAAKIEGLARHCSQHAAGVVITPVPTTDIVPVRKMDEGQIVIQYSMDPIEKLGLVKMDFLGLRTLSIIEEALNNIKLAGKPVPDMEKIPMDDHKAYQLLREADTLGIFQLESDGIRRMIKQMQIDCFEDVIAALAMYRPGPLGSGMVDQYIKSKTGKMETKFLHPMLKDVLSETYGVILYQEQVMQSATILAGYSLGEADLLRRAMGKKKVEVMQQERAKFVSGCEKNGIKSAEAEKIFDIIEEFAGYGFNKSHSAAYALISYQTAWLKANFRTEFMAAYLSSQIGAKKEIIAEYVREVRRSGIAVLAPDVNSSMANFTAVDEVVRFGLGAIARAGAGAVSAILEARKCGKFKSFWDFVSRVDHSHVSKSVIESLIYAGALDTFTTNRAQLIAAVPEFIAASQSIKNNKNQASLFGEDITDESPKLPDVPDDDLFKKLEKEKDVMGIYISGHPFDQHEEEFKNHTNCAISDVPFWSSTSEPKVGGVVVEIAQKQTKKGDLMGILTLEDADDNIEVVFYPRDWEPVRGLITVGQPYVVEGEVKKDREPINIVARKITPLEELREKPSFVRLKLQSAVLQDPDIFREIGIKLHEYPGNSPVLLEIQDEAESYVISLSGERVNREKFAEIETEIGKIVEK